MFKNMSIRFRILALAGLLIFLSIVIAGAGWYAISQVSAALAESIRVARQAQFVTVGIREFAGADRRVVSYLQSMNSVTLNLPAKPVGGRTGTAASVEQSRNQN